MLVIFLSSQAILDMNVWQSSCEFTIPTPQSKFYVESPTKLTWDDAVSDKQSETLLWFHQQMNIHT